jgi:NADPH:quinone reductase-like Zn-dependent oxidoreductase
VDERWPATFPSGQGSDLAGVIEQLGDRLDSSSGDEVLGFTDQRASHAAEGTAAAARAEVLAELAQLIDAGRLKVPIANVYPLEDVRAAFTELAEGHTHGKIVLVP